MFQNNRGFIITQTPFRISFFGGGTDLPGYFREHGGEILGTTINKHMYVTINSLERFYDKRIRVSYSHLECVNSLKELKHDLCRVILDEHAKFEENEFVDIHTFADLPASSGIGSSSTFTVGMLNAIYLLHGQYRTPEQIAKEAIYIEREKLKEAGGWQDQYFAAFGGFNRIIFDKTGKVEVIPISIGREKMVFLEKACLMVFTSATRSSSDIQKHFSNPTHDKTLALHQTKFFVKEAMEILYQSKKPEETLYEFGKLLHRAWEIKRNLSEGISNNQIDEIYELAIRNGAYGGKICGAGGGGFILLICPPQSRLKVKEALSSYHILNLKFESMGSRPLYNKYNDLNDCHIETLAPISL